MNFKKYLNEDAKADKIKAMAIQGLIENVIITAGGGGVVGMDKKSYANLKEDFEEAATIWLEKNLKSFQRTIESKLN